MAIKPNYSALSKLNGTYAYAPFGWQVAKEGEPVGYALIKGFLCYLWELTPETQHLPKIKVDGYAHRQPVLNVEDLSPIHLVNRLVVPPVSEESIILQAYDKQRGEYLTTIFPASEHELNALFLWAKERYRDVVVGAADYTLG